MKIGYGVQRVYVATLLGLLGELLEAASTTDPALRAELRGFPEGTVIVREGERWSPPLQSPKEAQPFSARTYRVFVKDLYGLAELSNMMGQFRGFATLDDYRGAGVQYLVANEVNPALAAHGGFVTYVGHDGEGTAYMTMGGGCHGCSLSKATMLDGVQTMLSEAIPAVQRVRWGCRRHRGLLVAPS